MPRSISDVNEKFILNLFGNFWDKKIILISAEDVDGYEIL
jgi:hypothetical protein